MTIRTCRTISFLALAFFLKGLLLYPGEDEASKPKVKGFAGERIREKLDRGLVAVPLEGNRMYLGFRLLESDPPQAAFDILRRIDGGEQEKINREPLKTTTDFIDAPPAGARELAYSVRASNGAPSKEVKVRPAEKGKPYFSLPLREKTTFQKAGIADLNGDGRLDFVLKLPDSNVDPWYKYWKRSEGTYKIEVCLHDGTHLFRKDLGWSIERGIWYSPYIVYDLDGDGRAEIAIKTGEGDPRDAEGKVTSGPEYLSIWDGMTGVERTRIPWPSREGFTGPHAYNYYCRNQLCVAYLDGKTPCLVVVRGTYNTIKVVAYQFHDGKLQELWRWTDSEDGKLFRGQGAHSMHAVDIDGDGRDEVFLGSAVLDDNGTGLWSTGRGHPDHHYVGEIDPERPGLEVYYGIEPAKKRGAMCLVDARNGQEVWGLEEATRHVHSSGLCADIDPRHPGLECYAGERDFQDKRWLKTAKGELIDTQDLGLAPRAAFWDADPYKELVRGNRIHDYRGEDHLPRIEGRVIGIADILGDWREELIVSVPGELRIYTTTIPAKDRRVCLMQDSIYRLDVAIQAMGYTQIPMLSYCPSTQ